MRESHGPIRVFIVDDHDMLREGLQSFIRAYDDLELIGEAATGTEAVEKCLALRPDVVLMDLVMPEMDGVDAIRLIHNTQPGTQIIVLSSFGEEQLVKNALKNGASSYLLKNVSAARLAEAIRNSVKGIPTLAPEAAQALIQEAKSDPAPEIPLTSREKDVLVLMVAGLSNSKISEQLCISLYTVKNHVSSILSKMGAKSRTEAVSLAIRLNLV